MYIFFLDSLSSLKDSSSLATFAPSSACLVFQLCLCSTPRQDALFQNWLCRPLDVVESLSSFIFSPSSAAQDGFKGLVGNVVHLLLGNHHPPPALLKIELAQPLLQKAGQLGGNFARHHSDCWLASCLLYCQRATDGVRGDPVRLCRVAMLLR